MFVRAKTVKGKKYAYIVKNSWKRGKVKQETKKYLGRVIDIGEPQEIVDNLLVDYSLSLRECMIPIIAREFESRGFTFDGKHTIKKDKLVVKLTKKPYIVNEGKNVVLFLNKRYVYPKLLERLLDFFEPENEEDRKGERLAFRFRDAGINLDQDHFITLYKKIYLNDEN